MCVIISLWQPSSLPGSTGIDQGGADPIFRFLFRNVNALRDQLLPRASKGQLRSRLLPYGVPGLAYLIMLQQLLFFSKH